MELNKKEVKERVEAYRDELLDRLGKLVAINSEEGTPTADMPFGEGPAKALNTALGMLDKDGFKTVNVDNYAGYAEMGEGDKVIGVIGHLDVVPAKKSDGWDTEPYEMVEKDGIVYGRGVADDKGAVVASMISFKVIKDMGLPMNKRVRLIMGTNEETGSKCLEHYVEKEGHVDLGFTPDGDFPGIYGEKGIMRVDYSSKSSNILDVQGGNAVNIVCDKVNAKVKAGSFDEAKFASYIKENGLTFESGKDGDAVVLTVFGKAAHASTPDLGVNAISHLFAGLKAAGMEDPFVDFYCSRIGVDTNGASFFNEAVTDEYGDLTLNSGVISMKDGVVNGIIDIRFPVTFKKEEIIAKIKLEEPNGSFKVSTAVDPLFIDPKSPLVTSLASAYEEITGDHENKPMVIGGGTYAKEINNTMAFGCAFPGKDYRIHNTNEWCPVDELLLQAEIYVHAIMKLVEV